MNAFAWQRYLNAERRAHGKVLYTVTELAHVAGVSREALNVELARLRRRGVIERYAQGLYGLPGEVSPEVLLPAMDSWAYMTGSYALFMHNLMTQAPERITCFTTRYTPRARERHTPVGRFFFVCVRGRVYAPPPEGVLASPLQALCDFVYLMRRQGVTPEQVATFRHLPDADSPEAATILQRYPATVQRHVRRLVGAG